MVKQWESAAAEMAKRDVGIAEAGDCSLRPR